MYQDRLFGIAGGNTEHGSDSTRGQRRESFSSQHLGSKSSEATGCAATPQITRKAWHVESVNAPPAGQQPIDPRRSRLEHRSWIGSRLLVRFGRVPVSRREMHLLIRVKSRAGEFLSLLPCRVTVTRAAARNTADAVRNPADFARIHRSIHVP